MAGDDKVCGTAECIAGEIKTTLAAYEATHTERLVQQKEFQERLERKVDDLSECIQSVRIIGATMAQFQKDTRENEADLFMRIRVVETDNAATKATAAATPKIEATNFITMAQAKTLAAIVGVIVTGLAVLLSHAVK